MLQLEDWIAEGRDGLRKAVIRGSQLEERHLAQEERIELLVEAAAWLQSGNIGTAIEATVRSGGIAPAWSVR